MHPPVSDEKWAALRALREGKPPIFALLAVASGLHVTTIRERASRDNWEKQYLRTAQEPDFDPATAELEADLIAERASEGPEARRLRVNEFLRRQIDRIMAGADARGGKIDKARIDALVSLNRAHEQLATPATERAETEVDDDAELAAVLRRIDDRIIELAEAHAKWLVARERRTEMGPAG